MGSTANSIKPQCTHPHTNTQKIKHKIYQQRKNNQPPRVVGIPLSLIAELKLCMLLRKGYLRDAGRAVLALQLMLLKIQRKRAALQPARVTTTILHVLAPCTPNASRRRPAFLHFGPFSLSPFLSLRRRRGGKGGRALPWGSSQPPFSSAISGFAAAG